MEFPFSPAYLAALGGKVGRHDSPTDPRRLEVTGQVTEEVERLAQAMDGPMKRAQIQQALGLKHRDHFRDAYLLPALAAGLVAMTIPDKPRFRIGTASPLSGQPRREDEGRRLVEGSPR